MVHTVVSSARKTIVIGDDKPFCIIGERINPTGRKKLAAEMAAGDFSTVERDTIDWCGTWIPSTSTSTPSC